MRNRLNSAQRLKKATVSYGDDEEVTRTRGIPEAMINRKKPSADRRRPNSLTILRSCNKANHAHTHCVICFQSNKIRRNELFAKSEW